MAGQLREEVVQSAEVKDGECPSEAWCEAKDLYGLIDSWSRRGVVDALDCSVLFTAQIMRPSEVGPGDQGDVKSLVDVHVAEERDVCDMMNFDGCVIRDFDSARRYVKDLREELQVDVANV
jgi:hypothetical protein